MTATRAMKQLTAAAAIVLLAAATSGADVALTLGDDFPERGTPVEVRLSGMEPGESYSFSVTYRPNSETSRVEKVGLFDDAGSVLWTPTDAGITTLSVLDGAGETVISRNAAVRFDSPPVSGLLVMILAGLLLFGGSTVSMRRALEG